MGGVVFGRAKQLFQQLYTSETKIKHCSGNYNNIYAVGLTKIYKLKWFEYYLAYLKLFVGLNTYYLQCIANFICITIKKVACCIFLIL